MTAPTRFLIGHGERLVEPIPALAGGSDTPTPYTVEQARQRIGRMAQLVATEAAALPDRACPSDFTVASVTLHPAYLSKTGYPLDLLRATGLAPIGSRPHMVTPEQAARRVKGSDEPDRYHPTEPRPTTRLFVAATRANLTRWADDLLTPVSEDTLDLADKQIVRLERIESQYPGRPRSPRRLRHDGRDRVALNQRDRRRRPDQILRRTRRRADHGPPHRHGRPAVHSCPRDQSRLACGY